jgi:predicted permease
MGPGFFFDWRGQVFVALGVHWPSGVLENLSMLGKAIVPQAVLASGGTLAEINLKSIENKGFLMITQTIKLLLLSPRSEFV